MNTLRVETVFIGEIKINPRNPRKNQEAIDPVARSIATYGFLNPLICDEDLNLAAGHTRLEAAKRLGLTEVPVIRVPGLTGNRFVGFSIADNRTAEIAQWDEEALARIVRELSRDVDFELGSLGFDDRELTELLDQSVEEEEDKEDDAPPLPDAPVSKLGDLYLMGEHRLLCGDTTQIDDLRHLVEGEKIDCLLTDPPYGVSYLSRGENREKWGLIKNDDLDPASLEVFLKQFFLNTATVCRPGATAYVCHALGLAGVRIAFERSFLEAGFTLSATLTWCKQSASMGWGDYRHASEPLLYGWIGEGHRKIKDRTQTTVWQIDRESSLRHPTQKPVALFSRALRNSTIRGERVLDPFVGSGTTIIACEQLGRRCFAMELEPKYCDVAVQRWERYTGKKAEIVRTETGVQPAECMTNGD